MLKHDVGYHPYKLQIVQELKETDFVRWKNFCKQFLYLELLEDTELFFSNKAWFELNGCVNKQNMHYWSLIIQIGRLQNHCILNGLQCGAQFHSTKWFQQDSASPHTTNSVIQCLKQKFSDGLIVWTCCILVATSEP